MVKGSNTDFTLNNCLFAVVALPKSTIKDKYEYDGCGIGFDAHLYFSLSNSREFGKNVIILGVGNSS